MGEDKIKNRGERNRTLTIDESEMPLLKDGIIYDDGGDIDYRDSVICGDMIKVMELYLVKMILKIK